MFGPRFALGAFMAWLVITLGWWALAFAPLPAPDSWLAQARVVCFGTLPNGLPAAWGWGALIISPLAMLGLLLALLAGDLRRAFSTLARRRLGQLAIALIAAAPSLGALWVGQRVVEARAAGTVFDASTVALQALPAGYPVGNEPAPPLGLVNQTGERVTVASLRGRPTLVTFAFGHCLTICPVLVKTVREAAQELAPQPLAVVVVSIDPWRDTPSGLGRLHRAWQLESVPDSHVLSGAVEEVLTVLEAWKMPIQRDERTGDVAHPGLVAVLDADGIHAYSFSTPPADWLVEAIRRLGAPGADVAG